VLDRCRDQGLAVGPLTEHHSAPRPPGTAS
jgi:hypothetical protein